LACGLFLCGASGASAAIYDFDFKDNSGFSSSFQFDTSGDMFFSAARTYFGQSFATGQVLFYNTTATTRDFGSPLNFQYNDMSASQGYTYAGAQLYSGPEADPVFSLCSYDLSRDSTYGGAATTGTLTISQGGAPGSPSPEVGAGLLSALAAAAALFLTRTRSPKARLANT
jgi:hypothetical protein